MTKEIFCSFCGLASTEVDKIIAGPDVYICCNCVQICNDLLRDKAIEEQKSIKTD